MSDPPRAAKPANATIEIDKSELEVILGSTPPPPGPQVSSPPPLPPEEIARAQSMAPAQPIGIPAAPGAAPPSTRPSLLPYVLISLAVVVFTCVAVASLYYHTLARTVAPPPIASSSAPSTEATASASPSSAPAGTTLTIHTVELGGKPSE